MEMEQGWRRAWVFPEQALHLNQQSENPSDKEGKKDRPRNPWGFRWSKSEELMGRSRTRAMATGPCKNRVAPESERFLDICPRHLAGLLPVLSLLGFL